MSYEREESGLRRSSTPFDQRRPYGDDGGRAAAAAAAAEAEAEVGLLLSSSVTLLLIGVFCIFCNAFAIVFSDPFAIYCHGLVCGILFIVSGIIGMVTRNRNKWATTLVVVSIVSASFSLSLLLVGIYGSFRIGHDAQRCTDKWINCTGQLFLLQGVPLDCIDCSCLTPDRYSGIHGPVICTQQPKLILTMEICLAVLGLLAIPLAIWCAHCGCFILHPDRKVAPCTDKTPTFGVPMTDYQSRNVQLTSGGQTSPIGQTTYPPSTSAGDTINRQPSPETRTVEPQPEETTPRRRIPSVWLKDPPITSTEDPSSLPTAKTVATKASNTDFTTYPQLIYDDQPTNLQSTIKAQSTYPRSTTEAASTYPQSTPTAQSTYPKSTPTVPPEAQPTTAKTPTVQPTLPQIPTAPSTYPQPTPSAQSTYPQTPTAPSTYPQSKPTSQPTYPQTPTAQPTQPPSTRQSIPTTQPTYPQSTPSAQSTYPQTPTAPSTYPQSKPTSQPTYPQTPTAQPTQPPTTRQSIPTTQPTPSAQSTYPQTPTAYSTYPQTPTVPSTYPQTPTAPSTDPQTPSAPSTYVQSKPTTQPTYPQTPTASSTYPQTPTAPSTYPQTPTAPSTYPQTPSGPSTYPQSKPTTQPTYPQTPTTQPTYPQPTPSAQSTYPQTPTAPSTYRQSIPTAQPTSATKSTNTDHSPTTQSTPYPQPTQTVRSASIDQNLPSLSSGSRQQSISAYGQRPSIPLTSYESRSSQVRQSESQQASNKKPSATCTPPSLTRRMNSLREKFAAFGKPKAKTEVRKSNQIDDVSPKLPEMQATGQAFSRTSQPQPLQTYQPLTNNPDLGYYQPLTNSQAAGYNPPEAPAPYTHPAPTYPVPSNLDSVRAQQSQSMPVNARTSDGYSASVAQPRASEESNIRPWQRSEPSAQRTSSTAQDVVIPPYIRQSESH